MSRIPVLILSSNLVLALAGVGPAEAQDAHYWHRQYGNRAYLLGGAVIGSAEDVSAVYYNPALLVFLEHRSLSASGSAYHAYDVALDNALGRGKNLTTSVVGAEPSLVAGEISLGETRDRRLAYSILFRHDFNAVMELRGPVSLPGLLGDARARIAYEDRIDEMWSGLSFAQRVGKGVSVGASLFTTYRTHRSRRNFLTVSDTIGEYGAAIQRDDFDYTYVGLVVKLGVGGRAGDASWGITTTVPAIRLAGSGSKSYDRLLVAFQQDPDQLLEYLVTDTQSGIRTEYRTPVSIGVGFAYRVGSARLHTSAEWFDGLDAYRVLDTAPLEGPGDPDPIDFDLRESGRSVVNWGLGMEVSATSTVAVYAGYHTDRSTIESPEPGGPIGVWDLHHVSGGVTLQFGDKRISLGAVHARGSEPIPGAVDLVPGILDTFGETSLIRDLEAEYRSFTLLIGIDVDY